MSLLVCRYLSISSNIRAIHFYLSYWNPCTLHFRIVSAVVLIDITAIRSGPEVPRIRLEYKVLFILDYDKTDVLVLIVIHMKYILKYGSIYKRIHGLMKKRLLDVILYLRQNKTLLNNVLCPFKIGNQNLFFFALHYLKPLF